MFKRILVVASLMFCGAAYASPMCEWPSDPSAEVGNYDPYARAISNMANEGCRETAADHIKGLRDEERILREQYNMSVALLREDPSACYGCKPHMNAMKRRLSLYPAAIAAAAKYPGAATVAEAESYRERLIARAAQRPQRKTMAQFREEAQAREKRIMWERCDKSSGYNCEQYR